jgi:hypothetical protein
MFAVEFYAAVRQFVFFIEGKSRREAARALGLSRDAIAKMCRFSAPPGHVRTKEPRRPKLGPLVPVIDAILEADKTAPPKQQHRAKGIFQRLGDEHGLDGGYSVVTRSPPPQGLDENLAQVLFAFDLAGDVAHHAAKDCAQPAQFPPRALDCFAWA